MHTKPPTNVPTSPTKPTHKQSSQQVPRRSIDKRRSPSPRRTPVVQRRVTSSPTPGKRNSGYFSGSDSDSRMTTLHTVNPDQARQIVIGLAKRPSTPKSSRKHTSPSPTFGFSSRPVTPRSARRQVSSPTSGRSSVHNSPQVVRRRLKSPTNQSRPNISSPRNSIPFNKLPSPRNSMSCSQQTSPRNSLPSDKRQQNSNIPASPNTKRKAPSSDEQAFINSPLIERRRLTKLAQEQINACKPNASPKVALPQITPLLIPPRTHQFIPPPKTCKPNLVVESGVDIVAAAYGDEDDSDDDDDAFMSSCETFEESPPPENPKQVS